MRKAWILGLVVLVGCATGDFATLEQLSREGRDRDTLALAQRLLADPELPAVTRARTELVVALAHRRQQEWTLAAQALERAEQAGIAQDQGWYRDYWPVLKADLVR